MMLLQERPGSAGILSQWPVVECGTERGGRSWSEVGKTLAPGQVCFGRARYAKGNLELGRLRGEVGAVSEEGNPQTLVAAGR